MHVGEPETKMFQARWFGEQHLALSSSRALSEVVKSSLQTISQGLPSPLPPFCSAASKLNPPPPSEWNDLHSKTWMDRMEYASAQMVEWHLCFSEPCGLSYPVSPWRYSTSNVLFLTGESQQFLSVFFLVVVKRRLKAYVLMCDLKFLKKRIHRGHTEDARIMLA